MEAILQYGGYVALLIVLAVPLGFYIEKVMNGRPVLLAKVLGPVERAWYRMLRIDAVEEMRWQKYLLCVLTFSAFGFVLLFLLLVTQQGLPLKQHRATWN